MVGREGDVFEACLTLKLKVRLSCQSSVSRADTASPRGLRRPRGPRGPRRPRGAEPRRRFRDRSPYRYSQLNVARRKLPSQDSGRESRPHDVFLAQSRWLSDLQRRFSPRVVGCRICSVSPRPRHPAREDLLAQQKEPGRWPSSQKLRHMSRLMRDMRLDSSHRVSEGTRTPDRLDHNQELYQLSYAHHGRMNLPAVRC
jgi:hypothetical protein